MKTKERLKMFVKSLNMGQNTFEKEVGIANGYLASKSLTVSSDTIERVLDKYPQLNLDWLFRGEGDMLRTSGINTGDVQNVYETLVTDKDEQIEELKAEVNRLLGENNVMREQLGMSQRKGKSA